MVMTPAEAFFARTEHVPLERGRRPVCGRMVAPYPPGMPRLLPGQRISRRTSPSCSWAWMPACSRWGTATRTYGRSASWPE